MEDFADGAAPIDGQQPAIDAFLVEQVKTSERSDLLTNFKVVLTYDTFVLGW